MTDADSGTDADAETGTERLWSQRVDGADNIDTARIVERLFQSDDVGLRLTCSDGDAEWRWFITSAGEDICGYAPEYDAVSREPREVLESILTPAGAVTEVHSVPVEEMPLWGDVDGA